MIKKISIEQIKPGVFVHDFNTSSNSSYLVTNQALIRDMKIVDMLRSLGVKDVYIDTDKGLDVRSAKSAQQARWETDAGLQELAQQQAASIRSVPLQEEIRHAIDIKKKAVSVIQGVMENVSSGGPLEVKRAYQLINDMEGSLTRNRDALVLLTRIRKKDEYTLMHSISVGAYIINFCNFFKISSQKTMTLAFGALFHDIGKMKIPLAILNKPGKLEDDEFAEMKRHTIYSSEILKRAKGLPEVTHDIGLHHHERFDGTGYPDGLKGDGIKPGSQLVAIADVFDAITSDRCYRNAMGRVEGLRKLYDWSEYHFNKDLTHKFIQSIGVYPIGSCVRMDSGRIGVVVGSTESLVQPVVRIFYDEKKQRRVTVHDFDLSLSEDYVVSYEDPEKWDLAGMYIFEEMVKNLFSF